MNYVTLNSRDMIEVRFCNVMAQEAGRKIVTTNIRYVAVGAISIRSVLSKCLLSP